ncbi:MAG: chemotaxis protein CheD [Candidatus Hydrogenedentes bacterium]|nr:chemotaxis protein CheD [Candidatus Hydrogenedentota bacterium]
MKKTVGISEMLVSRQAEDVLVTYSLGSCVGVAVYDPEIQVGGLIHCMLPLSRLDPERAKRTPEMFTDTGVPALLKAVLDLGASRKRLVVRVAGGAAPLSDNGVFKIGERNYTVLRKVLWKNDILIAGESVGGTVARTMTLYMDTGRTTVRTGGVEQEL